MYTLMSIPLVQISHHTFIPHRVEKVPFPSRNFIERYISNTLQMASNESGPSSVMRFIGSTLTAPSWSR